MKKLKDKKGIALMPLIIIIAVLLIGAGIVLFTLIFNSNEKGKSNTLDSATSGDIGENSNSSLKVGDYVEYDVSYTDVYTDYNFTSKDGWRVLDPGVENEDGTFSGVKLISTGLPAKGYYGTDIFEIETDGKTAGMWAGNEEQRQEYADKFYMPENGNINSENMYGAAGLYYNFELIEFTSGTYGMYKEIRGKTDGEVMGKDFILEEMAEGVHNLTLEELNKARGEEDKVNTDWVSQNDASKGLFYLSNLENYGYDESASGDYEMSHGDYFIASPYPNNDNANFWLLTINRDGIFDVNFDDYYTAVRPVISLKSNIKINKINTPKEAEDENEINKNDSEKEKIDENLNSKSNSSLKVGDYVEYDVPYTDIETNYKFTSKDGWRVLDPGTENQDGIFSGVKLISTGLPANLLFSSSDIKDIETDGSTIGKWAGNAKQRQEYADKFYISKNDDINNENMYAAAGLYYNFELIKFTRVDLPEINNQGGYKQIRNKTNEDISGKEFIVEGVAEEVHNLTLEELNKARNKKAKSKEYIRNIDEPRGLLNLGNLIEYGYNNDTAYNYFLASPYSRDKEDKSTFLSVDSFLNSISFDGGRASVRPVVTLKSNIKINKIEK